MFSIFKAQHHNDRLFEYSQNNGSFMGEHFQKKVDTAWNLMITQLSGTDRSIEARF